MGEKTFHKSSITLFFPFSPININDSTISRTCWRKNNKMIKNLHAQSKYTLLDYIFVKT